MKTRNLQFAITCSWLVILILACNGQTTNQPTATNAPVPTETPTLLPTAKPTLLATLPPTETPTLIPSATPTITATAAPPTQTALQQPASLIGDISLSGDEQKPFASLIELREKDSYALIGNGRTDANGGYKINNIEPGIYDLWVLITTKIDMISGCDDVTPPDNNWKIGISFGDKALTIENAYLSKAVMLADELQSSDLKADGFFAVLEGFEIKSGIENQMDVSLLCK